jgi:hypothetical protein
MYGTFMRAEVLPTGRNVYFHISRHANTRAKLFKCNTEIHTPNSHNIDTEQARRTNHVWQNLKSL